jgi:ABC-type polysaccharide/polyol phosphate export permease
MASCASLSATSTSVKAPNGITLCYVMSDVTVCCVKLCAVLCCIALYCIHSFSYPFIHCYSSPYCILTQSIL